MNPSGTNNDQKPPRAYGQTATGIPVISPEGYNVGVNQPHVLRSPAQPISLSPWSTGLCHCFDDVANCCITCWCPCITFGQIVEIVDKGESSCCLCAILYTLLACTTGCQFICSCCYRSKMRQQYMLEDRPCPDCLVHCCCEPCALCQEYRELRNRGFDMTIGWQQNIGRQNRGVAMAPVVQGGMER